MAAMMMRSSVRRFAASAGHGHGASSQSALAHEIAEEHHAIGSRNLWKNISLFFAIPVVLVTAVNTYVQATKHEAHHHPDASHQPPHMHIRAKPFPWGDGDKSLFHNPHVNA